jgi:hypothetical protein
VLSDKLVSVLFGCLKEELSEGEKADILLMLWNLSANSERGKAILRSFSLLPLLESIITSASTPSQLQQLGTTLLSLLNPITL